MRAGCARANVKLIFRFYGTPAAWSTLYNDVINIPRFDLRARTPARACAKNADWKSPLCEGSIVSEDLVETRGRGLDRSRNGEGMTSVVLVIEAKSGSTSEQSALIVFLSGPLVLDSRSARGLPRLLFSRGERAVIGHARARLLREITRFTIIACPNKRYIIRHTLCAICFPDCCSPRSWAHKHVIWMGSFIHSRPLAAFNSLLRVILIAAWSRRANRSLNLSQIVECKLGVPGIYYPGISGNAFARTVNTKSRSIALRAINSNANEELPAPLPPPSRKKK